MREGRGCCGGAVGCGECLPASLPRLDCLLWLWLPWLSVCGSDYLAMALADDLAVSAWLSFFVLSGASGQSSFRGARFRRLASKKWIKRTPRRHLRDMRRNQGSACDLGDEASGAGERARLVTHRRAVNGVRDMRQRSDTAAASTGQGEREGNRWINSGSRIDLEGMTTEPTSQLAGALGARAGLRETDRCAAHF